MQAYREEKSKVKRFIYQIKKKMNEDVNGNRKLFLKEMSNAKGGRWRVATE